tara:strand:- start:215 stop:1045 length:831 start_codon:yes stop_codon:yes gene_type:complete
MRRDPPKLLKPLLKFESIKNDHFPYVDVSHSVGLYVEGLTVTFDGFRALDNFNLYVDHGELRCLIGANGAGKTTLMDVITGRTKPDSGDVYFGQNINLIGKTETEIAQLGIARKFQNPTVFEHQTVFSNLELALHGKRGIFDTLLGDLSSDDLDRIDEVLAIIGLKDRIESLAGSLSHGQKQWLEIGMLLSANPRLLLVDEPAAGMTRDEAERTAELLTNLAGDRTIIVIEHDMEFIRSIASRVTVMHQGQMLAEGSITEIKKNPSVLEVYLGEEY